MAIFLKGNDVSTFANDVKKSTEGNSKFPGYQQGALIPVLTGEGATWGPYYAQQGTWSRVGQTVLFSMYVAAENTNTLDVLLEIVGLPYAVSDSASSVFYSITVGYISKLNTPDLFTAYLDPLTASSRIILVKPGLNGAARQSLNCSIFNDPDSRIMLSSHYLTDDITWQPINGATVS